VGEFLVGKNVLVTGGTGSIGSEIVRQVLRRGCNVVRVFSRDETKQFYLQHELRAHENVRYLIGDVRDRERVLRAMDGIDVVFHAAALKHVPLSEYNPFEATETNVRGTQNVLSAAVDRNADRVVVISTDKAVSPMNVVGATKLLAERLATAANYLRGDHRTRMASVRFGNVIGSRGSLVPLVLRQIREGGPVTVTDPEMTRFVISPAQAVQLVFTAAERMEGGEVFVLKMRIARILDVVEVLIEEYGPRYGYDPSSIAVEMVGRRPGEKLSEVLMTEEEAALAKETDDMYIIRQDMDIVHLREPASRGRAPEYSSGQGRLLTKEEIRRLVREVAPVTDAGPVVPGSL